MVVNFRARGISRGARKLARTPTLIKKKKVPTYTKACSPAVARSFLAFAFWVQALACTPVTLTVPYMFTRFAGYLVSRGISRGARKLARTPT